MFSKTLPHLRRGPGRAACAAGDHKLQETLLMCASLVPFGCCHYLDNLGGLETWLESARAAFPFGPFNRAPRCIAKTGFVSQTIKNHTNCW